MKEYKILTDNSKICQSRLNLWNEDYKLEILAMSSAINSLVHQVTILLTREPR